LGQEPFNEGSPCQAHEDIEHYEASRYLKVFYLPGNAAGVEPINTMPWTHVEAIPGGPGPAVDIRTPADAVDFVMFCIDAMRKRYLRPMAEWVSPIETVDDEKPYYDMREGLQLWQRDADRLGVTPPTARAEGDGFRVAIWCLEQLFDSPVTVARWSLHVSRRGEISTADKVAVVHVPEDMEDRVRSNWSKW
jgi:hypothetical protein